MLRSIGEDKRTVRERLKTMAAHEKVNDDGCLIAVRYRVASLESPFARVGSLEA